MELNSQSEKEKHNIIKDHVVESHNSQSQNYVDNVDDKEVEQRAVTGDR